MKNVKVKDHLIIYRPNNTVRLFFLIGRTFYECENPYATILYAQQNPKELFKNYLTYLDDSGACPELSARESEIFTDGRLVRTDKNEIGIKVSNRFYGFSDNFNFRVPLLKEISVDLAIIEGFLVFSYQDKIFATSNYYEEETK